MSEPTGPCAGGQDLEFLRACALANDFSLLVDGVVKPEYMSEDVSMVATWIVERRYEPNAVWPPSYSTLRMTFPYLKWPPEPEDSTGIDPSIWAADVIYEYRTWHLAQMQGRLLDAMTQDIQEDSYQLLLSRLDSDMITLRNLGSAEKRPVRLGEDPEAMLNRILGIGIPKARAKFRMHLDVFNKLNQPYTSGMYCVFGRPKSGKSFVIERSAVAYTIEDGFRGILVDPENDTEVLETRVACIWGGLDLDEVRNVRLKFDEGQELTERDTEVYDLLLTAVAEINVRSKLLLIGKDQKEKDEPALRLEYVFRMAQEFDAHAIYAEQIHKYIAPTLTRRNDGEYVVIRKISQILADSQYVVVASTQEKRANNKSTNQQETRILVPHQDLVYGGDGVAQNCTFLGHVQKFELEDGKLLQLITPLLARNGHVGTQEVWLLSQLCTSERVLTQYEGRARAKAHLLSIQKRQEAAEKKGADMANERQYVDDDIQRARNFDKERLNRPGLSRPLRATMRDIHDEEDEPSPTESH